MALTTGNTYFPTSNSTTVSTGDFPSTSTCFPNANTPTPEIVSWPMDSGSTVIKWTVGPDEAELLRERIQELEMYIEMMEESYAAS